MGNTLKRVDLEEVRVNKSEDDKYQIQVRARVKTTGKPERLTSSDVQKADVKSTIQALIDNLDAEK